MIVSKDDSGLVLITQADHAKLACDLLELWRIEGLPEHPRRRDLLFAAREHDNGWQRVDAAPMVSPESGLPVSFDRLPSEQRLEIWRRGSRRYLDEQPWASRLIIRHARRVNREVFDEPAWEEFGAWLAQTDLELAELGDLSDSELEADYRWLELVDLVSLGACGAFSGPEPVLGECSGYRFSAAPGRIALSPFPLAGSTTLEVSCRRLPKRRYSGTVDLTGELVAATWQKMGVRIEPLAPLGAPGLVIR